MWTNVPSNSMDLTAIQLIRIYTIATAKRLGSQVFLSENLNLRRQWIRHPVNSKFVRQCKPRQSYNGIFQPNTGQLLRKDFHAFSCLRLQDPTLDELEPSFIALQALQSEGYWWRVNPECTIPSFKMVWKWSWSTMTNVSLEEGANAGHWSLFDHLSSCSLYYLHTSFLSANNFLSFL